MLDQSLLYPQHAGLSSFTHDLGVILGDFLIAVYCDIEFNVGLHTVRCSWNLSGRTMPRTYQRKTDFSRTGYCYNLFVDVTLFEIVSTIKILLTVKMFNR